MSELFGDQTPFEETDRKGAISKGLEVLEKAIQRRKFEGFVDRHSQTLQGYQMLEPSDWPFRYEGPNHYDPRAIPPSNFEQVYNREMYRGSAYHHHYSTLRGEVVVSEVSVTASVLPYGYHRLRVAGPTRFDVAFRLQDLPERLTLRDIEEALQCQPVSWWESTRHQRQVDLLPYVLAAVTRHQSRP